MHVEIDNSLHHSETHIHSVELFVWLGDSMAYDPLQKAIPVKTKELQK